MNKKIMIKKSQNYYPCDFPRTDEKISGGSGVEEGGGMRPILECVDGLKGVLRTF